MLRIKPSKDCQNVNNESYLAKVVYQCAVHFEFCTPDPTSYSLEADKSQQRSGPAANNEMGFCSQRLRLWQFASNARRVDASEIL